MYRDQLPSLSGTIHSLLFPFANFTSYKPVHLYLINDNWNCKMSRFFCFVSIFGCFSVSKIMSCERFFLCQKMVFTRHLSRSVWILLQLIRWLFRRVNASFPPTHSVLYLCQLWKMTGVLLTYFIRTHSQSISLSQNHAIKIQSVIISLIVGWKTNAGLDN